MQIADFFHQDQQMRFILVALSLMVSTAVMADPNYELSVEVLMASGSPDQIWELAETYVESHGGVRAEACDAHACSFNHISDMRGGSVIETTRRRETAYEERELCTVTIKPPMHRHCINVDTRNSSDWQVVNSSWVLMRK